MKRRLNESNENKAIMVSWLPNMLVFLHSYHSLYYIYLFMYGTLGEKKEGIQIGRREEIKNSRYKQTFL